MISGRFLRRIAVFAVLGPLGAHAVRRGGCWLNGLATVAGAVSVWEATGLVRRPDATSQAAAAAATVALLHVTHSRQLAVASVVVVIPAVHRPRSEMARSGVVLGVAGALRAGLWLR